MTIFPTARSRRLPALAPGTCLQGGVGRDRTQHPELRNQTRYAIAYRAGALGGGNCALVLAREPVGLLYNPALPQLQDCLPQSQVRNLDPHKRILYDIRRRDADHAERWMRKHLIDFQRGFVMARLDMHVPISLPT